MPPVTPSRRRPTARLRHVGVNASAVASDTETLRLNLGENLRVTAQRTDARVTDDGLVEWHGQLTTSIERSAGADHDERNSVMLVRNGDSVSGSVRVNGKLFRLTPTGQGQHALVVVDERRTPPELPPQSVPRANSRPAAPQPAPDGVESANSQPAAPQLAPDGVETVRVLVAVTETAQREIGDLESLVNLAVAESNRGFANSEVPVVFELAGIHRTNYQEVAGASHVEHLNRFQGTSDGFMDEVHAVRDSVNADVAVLLDADRSSCGYSPYLDDFVDVPASHAFAAVLWWCATGNYSFAHEIGHIFGARHDPANDTHPNPPYPYGYGYQFDGPAEDWRTIMALDCPVSCPRLNYWSNPRVTYNGVPMGTAATHDNARLLGEQAPRVAGFRPPPSTPLADGTYRIRSEVGGHDLDVTDCQSHNGADVRVFYRIPSSPCQRWQVTRIGDNTYTIIDDNSRKALEVSGCSTGDGATVQLWGFHGGACQTWRVNDVGGGVFSIIGTGSGKSLDVAGCSPNAGADVVVWPHHGGSCQRWYFDRVQAEGGVRSR